MTLHDAIAGVLRQVHAIASDHDASPESCDIHPHDDEPGALQAIMALSCGHLFAVTFVDDVPFTPERRADLESAFIAAAAVVAGLH